MFSKVFFEKVFFRNFHKRRTTHPPEVLSVLAPLAAKVRYQVQITIKENLPRLFHQVSNTVWSAASLSIAGAKVDLLTLTGKLSQDKLSGFPETFL